MCAVRQERYQAVLAFQGKPLNAWAASAARVDGHAQYRLLAQALGLAAATGPAGAAELDRLRFERLCLLFDPDADGIHLGALLVMYVQRWLPGLIAQRRLWMLRAPMFEIVDPLSGEVHLADHPAACRALVDRLQAAAGGRAPRVQAHRGLGSITPALLREHCVDPATRRAWPVEPAEVQALASAFGAG